MIEQDFVLCFLQKVGILLGCEAHFIFDLRTFRRIAKQNFDSTILGGHIIVQECIKYQQHYLSGCQVGIRYCRGRNIWFWLFLLTNFISILVRTDKFDKSTSRIQYTFLHFSIDLIIGQGDISSQLFSYITSIVSQKGINCALWNVDFLLLIIIIILVVFSIKLDIGTHGTLWIDLNLGIQIIQIIFNRVFLLIIEKIVFIQSNVSFLCEFGKLSC
mmetsp:Transcript_13250/g.23975  ORF Transcript_13250/g.23975 Transcript_13250/m.23975 type:complete len:216 (+) Transcript_13250:2015-2662(+)